MLRQTTVPTVIDSFYLLTLGAYRGLYILNWIWRAADANDRPPNAVSVIFGIIQTALYVDFFWVYYTRQRVKLRGGGVVDADDIRRGWLLRRIFGNRRFEAAIEGDDEESAPALGRGGPGGVGGVGIGGNGDGNASSARRSKWGARGISVSADEGVYENQGQSNNQGQSQSQSQSNSSRDQFSDDSVDPDAKMKDPDELARVLDGSDDDDDDDDSSEDETSARSGKKTGPAGVSNGSEWRD